MTFAQIKQSILNVAKTAEVCGVYQSILNSANEQDLITYGKQLAEWSYKNEIITDTLLAEFDQLNLNANQIYLTGTHTLNNPIGEIFVFGTANVIINKSQDYCKVFSFSSSIVELNLTATGYVDAKVFNATLNINQEQDSICCCEFTDTTTSSIITKDNSVCHARIYDNSSINTESNQSSYIKVQGFYNSNINGTQNDTSEINVQTNQDSTYNGTPL